MAQSEPDKGTKVIRPQMWSDEELAAQGFQRYDRKKQLVMARALPETEAPLVFEWPLETLVIEAGYMICYDPGQDERPALNDYDHWPVEPAIFERTFRKWDDADWTPSPAERHLMRCGCAPYFKVEPVWAKKLIADTYVQSLESREPVLVPAGFWLAIGAMGEPWYIDGQTFRYRYFVAAASPTD